MEKTKTPRSKEFRSFRRYTKRILSVPKSEIDKRASADKRGPAVPKGRLA